MAGTFADFLNEIKTTYPSKKVALLANKERPFTASLNKSLPSTNVASDSGILQFNLQTAWGESVGSHDEDGYIPVPKDRIDVPMTLKPKLFSASTQIGQIVKSAVRSGKSGFNGGVAARNAEDTTANLAKHIEQMFAATHGTARLGVIESDGVSNFIVAAPEGLTLFRRNTSFSVRTSDGADAIRDNLDFAYVTKLDWDTRTVTYAGVADKTAVAGDSIHHVTVAAQTNLSTVSAMGIRGIIDNGTYSPATFQNITRANYPETYSQVSSNGGTKRNITEGLLMDMCRRVRQIAGSEINELWASPGQLQMYAKYARADRRTVTSGAIPGKIQQGFSETSLSFVNPQSGKEIPFSSCIDMIPGEIFGINWNTIFHYEAEPMGWWDVSGSNGLPIPGTGTFKLKWFQAMRSVENIGSDNPGGNFVIRDLFDPANDSIPWE